MGVKLVVFCQAAQNQTKNPIQMIIQITVFQIKAFSNHLIILRKMERPLLTFWLAWALLAKGIMVGNFVDNGEELLSDRNITYSI